MNPHAQGKLVFPIRGRIFDVAVDIRKGSPTYGRWVAVELSSDDPSMLYVPSGFAHGFQVLSEEADVTYRVADYRVVALDRFFFGRDTLPEAGNGLEIVQGDIRTLDESVFEGIDAVIDLAAVSNDATGGCQRHQRRSV